MRWSLELGSVAGIAIRVHATFALLLAWVGLTELAGGRGGLAAALAVAFTVTIFAVVVLHELGHALVARAFGIRTRDITLLPIGGVARLERIPEQPYQELLVALAGPAVNVGLAGLLLGALVASGVPVLPAAADGVPLVALGFVAKLFWANVALAVFNMLPAFPMDGGRALRALFATVLEYTQATQAAATIGQVLAVLLGFLGAFTNPMLILIAIFVWTGAAQEAALVQARAAMRGIPVRRAMATRFQALDAGATLAEAAERVREGFQHDFPVTEGGRVVGVLTLADLVRGLSERGAAARIADVMDRSFQVADPRELLAPAVERLDASRCRSLPVLEGDRLVGVLTPENVGELFMFQEAIRA